MPASELLLRHPERVDTVDIPNIELMKAGTWNASTGRTTVTPEDFQSAIDGYNDQLVDRPPLKIGHTDPRFASNDGTPAMGWITNLRAGIDKDGIPTLLGDAKRVPAKLAERMKDAFRHRSAEVKYGFRTAAGKTYRMVFTGLALLGASAPAIKNLDDIHALYGEHNGSAWASFDSIFFGDTPTIPGGAPSAPHSGGDQPPATGGPVDSAALRSALSLAATATDAEVAAAFAAATAPTPEPELTAEQVAANAATADELARRVAAAKGAPAPMAVAASGTLETVTITKSMWDEVQAGLAKAAKDGASLAIQRRDSLITTALSEARITDKDVPMVVQLFGDGSGESAVTMLLTTLSPRVHTQSAGYSADSPYGAPATFSAAPGELTDAAVAESMAFIGLTHTKVQA